MNIHNKLVDLAENDFGDSKNFEAKVFESAYYKDFLYFAIMLLEESLKTEDKLRKIQLSESWTGYNPNKPNKLKFMRLQVVKRNLLLGIGSEYLFKAVFLKNGYGINKVQRNSNINSPYRLSSQVTNRLNVSETVTFWYLKQYLLNIVDLSSFDDEITRENQSLVNSEQTIYRPKNISRLYYKKPDSKGCLNLIYGIRNNYSHNSFIKTEFSGFFKDAIRFLNFLCKNQFGKEINKLYNKFKPERN